MENRNQTVYILNQKQIIKQVTKDQEIIAFVMFMQWGGGGGGIFTLDMMRLHPEVETVAFHSPFLTEKYLICIQCMSDRKQYNTTNFKFPTLPFTYSLKMVLLLGRAFP